MEKIKKTAAGCVLHGVPQVRWGREVDGEVQETPFTQCLHTVLTYMGQKMSYTEIMAYSGAAFRMGWGGGDHWCPSSSDLQSHYDTLVKPFELTFRGIGRGYDICGIPEGPDKVKKEEAIEFVKSEIENGRPVIAFGVVGPCEAGIITGYQSNGEVVLGWSVFQDWAAQELDESGYYVQDNWWANTTGLISIGEETGAPASDKAVLENALMLMSANEVRGYGGEHTFYAGQAAYEKWAKALECENFDAEGASGDGGQCETMELLLGERGYAAAYMNFMAERYPDLADECKECARLLKATVDCIHPMRALQEEPSNWLENKETRQQMATLVRKAAKYEKEACVVLKGIIDKV